MTTLTYTLFSCFFFPVQISFSLALKVDLPWLSFHNTYMNRQKIKSSAAHKDATSASISELTNSSWSGFLSTWFHLYECVHFSTLKERADNPNIMYTWHIFVSNSSNAHTFFGFSIDFKPCNDIEQQSIGFLHRAHVFITSTGTCAE